MRVTVTIRQVYDWIDEFAPFSTQEEWDNAGLLAGRWDAPVTRVLVALDLTDAVLDEAIQKGAQLIVTHHPILFRGRKNLCEEDAEGRLLCRLIRARIGMIAAHTNFDQAENGVNDQLCLALGMENIQPLDHGLRIGEIPPMPLATFEKVVAERLHTVVRTYGDAQKTIRRVAVCGGAGGEFWREGWSAGADAYVTGEMRYHDALTAAAEGFATLQAGHDGTERISIKSLVSGLQSRADVLQCPMDVFASDTEGSGCS